MRGFHFWAAALCLSLLWACADPLPFEDDEALSGHATEGVGSGAPDPEADIHDHEHTHTVDVQTDTLSRDRCGSRWTPPPSPSGADRISYDAALRCSGGPARGSLALAEHVRAIFPDVLDEQTAGRGVQIYNCRQVRGGRSRSVHSEGRAVDFMIPTVNGAANNAVGDRLANWLIQNASAIGIQYLIWDRTSWRGSRTPAGRCYTGSHPHHDHIHVELNRAAAEARTPFFRDMAGRSSAEETPPASQPAAPAQGSWLGQPCDADGQCESRRCQYDDQSISRTGWCAQSCDGWCPDRPGHPPTFCIAGDAVGSTGGSCVAQASRGNNWCQAWDGFEALRVARHVERSGAPQADAVVCLPARGGASVSDAPRAVPVHETPETAAEGHERNAVCADPSLPETDNGWSCSGFEEEHWRCGCDVGFERFVSQVCRRGRWLNYQLDPRDCQRCEGDYSAACE